jgi:outer membrane lipoprotein carrier protein
VANGRFACAIALLLCSMRISASVDTPETRLVALLAPVEQLSAEFTQTVLGSHHELLQSAQGYLRLARPHQFKWVLQAPYPQTIVTSGDRLFIYDPDLNQVQVKPLAEALAGTPALVLLGSAADIDAQFVVSDEIIDGLHRFVLIPTDPDALYTELHLVFSETRLVRIEIIDSLGQLTDVSFHNLQINVALASDEFEFAMPADADVIGDASAKPS